MNEGNQNIVENATAKRKVVTVIESHQIKSTLSSHTVLRTKQDEKRQANKLKACAIARV